MSLRLYGSTKKGRQHSGHLPLGRNQGRRQSDAELVLELEEELPLALADKRWVKSVRVVERVEVMR